MKLEFLKKKKLPHCPGVYFFKKNSQILYIGKATDLANRVASYFNHNLIKTRGPAIVDMVTKATSIDFEKTDSVLEALVLESFLIKKNQPIYNVKEKDNKSYQFVVITDEKYPKVKIIRGRELEELKKKKNFSPQVKKQYGPFPNANQLKQALKIIRKIFPFLENERISKLDIEIGLAPDIYNVKKSEYMKNIRNISLFFEGKKSKIVKNLKSEMKKNSKAQKYEKALEIKKQIFALEHINDVAVTFEDKNFVEGKKFDNHKKSFRIESYDISHLAGQNTVGAMVVLEDGYFKKSDYRKFIIKQSIPGDDCGALREVLLRRFGHREWPLPDLIVMDGGKNQLETAVRVIEEIKVVIPVVSVKKDDRHRAKEILGKAEYSKKYKGDIIKINQETHRFGVSFQRKKRNQLFI